MTAHWQCRPRLTSGLGSTHAPWFPAAVVRLAALQRAVPGVDVAAGFTHIGGLSEAEQMQRDWPLADVPVLLEVAGRNTAENASRSLPIVLALGVAARVTVVTSIWHLRAPYFFAPYREFGLLAEELGRVAGMARQRRATMDAVRLPAGA